MLIKFDNIEESVLKSFKGGENNTNLKIFTDGMNKIMKGRLEPNSSIGLHTHETNSEIIFITSGRGKVLCDGEYESVEAGDCHYCPKGHRHSLINDSSDELLFYAVVPEQPEA